MPTPAEITDRIVTETLRKSSEYVEEVLEKLLASGIPPDELALSHDDVPPTPIDAASIPLTSATIHRRMGDRLEPIVRVTTRWVRNVDGGGSIEIAAEPVTA